MDIMPTQSLSGFMILGALILGAPIHKIHAIGKGGSYDAIINRNAFHLISLPIDLPSVDRPANTIKLIGVSSVGGRRKAFLEITKPGRGKEILKPILEEGQSETGVEVLKINAEQGWVRVKHGGKETTLTFEKDGKTDVPIAALEASQSGSETSPIIRVSTRIASSSMRGPTSATAEVQATQPPTLNESVLRVATMATMTELTADSVKRGDLPPFPPTDLTPSPSPARVTDGTDLRRAATKISRGPKQ